MRVNLWILPNVGWGIPLWTRMNITLIKQIVHSWKDIIIGTNSVLGKLCEFVVTAIQRLYALLFWINVQFNFIWLFDVFVSLSQRFMQYKYNVSKCDEIAGDCDYHICLMSKRSTFVASLNYMQHTDCVNVEYFLCPKKIHNMLLSKLLLVFSKNGNIMWFISRTLVMGIHHSCNDGGHSVHKMIQFCLYRDIR